MKSKLLSAMMLFMVSTGVFAQQHFSTPEQATDALAKAINEQNDKELGNLLGEDWRTFLPSDGVDPEAVDRFKRDWQVNHHTVIDGDMAWLTVGEYHWQLPIPVVKRAEGWQFDMQEAKEEILNREVGRNELAAIDALHAYLDAQESYYALTTQYAQKIVS
ncbi:MAG: DUF2950 family protein, partial [Leclercia adecarboxylata]|nr:DUF2950 family protein [Leclercia adecarboxylata]